MICFDQSATFRSSFALLTGLLAVGMGSSQALVVRSYQAGSHDRFLNFPGLSTQANPNFIHAGLDLTGVGWDTNTTTRQITMVSPRHFVGASHHKPAVGAELRFLSADGTIRSYTVAGREAILNGQGDPTDLFVGTLTADIPSGAGVRFQPYLNLATESQYIGRPLVVLGKSSRGGRNTITAFSDFGNGTALGGGGINQTRMYAFAYNSLGGTEDDAYVEGGDSGSPALVATSGAAALVGVHSAVTTVGTATTSLDTFVPHYIAELNAIMEQEGYHMTQVTPATTAVTVTQQEPAGVIRAGYPFSLAIDLENDGSADANNLALVNLGPSGAEVAGALGTNWVSSAAPVGEVRARRGGLEAGGVTTLVVTMTASSPGVLQNEVRLSADEFGLTSNIAPLTVVASFRSWAAGLSSTSPESDADNDAIGLLLEYAFGGDPLAASRFLPGTEVSLLPEVSTTGPLTVKYIVRRDAAERLLRYDLELSHDLTPGSWLDAASLIGSTTVTPLPGEFDLVEAHLDVAGAERCFVRVRVTLSE